MLGVGDATDRYITAATVVHLVTRSAAILAMLVTTDSADGVVGRAAVAIQVAIQDADAI
jgi:hypothetical protein